MKPHHYEQLLRDHERHLASASARAAASPTPTTWKDVRGDCVNKDECYTIFPIALRWLFRLLLHLLNILHEKLVLPIFWFVIFPIGVMWFSYQLFLIFHPDAHAIVQRIRNNRVVRAMRAVFRGIGQTYRFVRYRIEWDVLWDRSSRACRRRWRYFIGDNLPYYILAGWIIVLFIWFLHSCYKTPQAVKDRVIDLSKFPNVPSYVGKIGRNEEEFESPSTFDWIVKGSVTSMMEKPAKGAVSSKSAVAERVTTTEQLTVTVSAEPTSHEPCVLEPDTVTATMTITSIVTPTQKSQKVLTVTERSTVTVSAAPIVLDRETETITISPKYIAKEQPTVTITTTVSAEPVVLERETFTITPEQVTLEPPTVTSTLTVSAEPVVLERETLTISQEQKVFESSTATTTMTVTPNVASGESRSSPPHEEETGAEKVTSPEKETDAARPKRKLKEGLFYCKKCAQVHCCEIH